MQRGHTAGSTSFTLTSRFLTDALTNVKDLQKDAAM